MSPTKLLLYCPPVIDKNGFQAYHQGVAQCSEEGCGRNAVARGLCSKHYQQHRRTVGINIGQLGRPREYDPEFADPHGGAPKLSVRFEPEVLEWVKEQGGAKWLRYAARELKRLSGVPEFNEWWGELSLPAEPGD